MSNKTQDSLSSLAFNTAIVPGTIVSLKTRNRAAKPAKVASAKRPSHNDEQLAEMAALKAKIAELEALVAAPVAVATAKLLAPRKTKGLSLNYPKTTAIKAPSPKTRRGKCATMMLRTEGATLEQIKEACAWNDAQAIGAVRLLHHDHGYGVSHGADGVLRLLDGTMPVADAWQAVAELVGEA